MTDNEGSSTERAEPESFAAAHDAKHEELHLDQSLYKPFELGDVKKIQSTPDHLVL